MTQEGFFNEVFCFLLKVTLRNIQAIPSLVSLPSTSELSLFELFQRWQQSWRALLTPSLTDIWMADRGPMVKFNDHNWSLTLFLKGNCLSLFLLKMLIRCWTRLSFYMTLMKSNNDQNKTKMKTKVFLGPNIPRTGEDHFLEKMVWWRWTTQKELFYYS